MRKSQYFYGILFLLLISFGLFFYATELYPGGNQRDLTEEGYNWMQNYWCNLMNEKGMNGKPNLGRPFAIASHWILCCALLIFFWGFATAYLAHNLRRIIFKLFALLCMVSAALIFSPYHDVMSTISSIFGLWLVVEILIWIYRKGQKKYLFSAVFIVLLLVLNNFIYYSEICLDWLPLIQKISFAFVLCWVLWLSYMLNSTLKNEQNSTSPI